jgi:hypothetical protein
MPVTMYSVSEAAAMSGLHRRIITNRCTEQKLGCQKASTGEWFLTKEEIDGLTAVKRGRGRPRTERSEAIDAALLGGMAPAKVAKHFGVAIQTVYNRKAALKPIQPVPASEPLRPSEAS